MDRALCNAALAAIAASVAIAGCGGSSITVDAGDGRPIAVECRTEPVLPAGECGGWAVTVARDATPGDVAGATRLVLTGRIQPGPDQDRCHADWFDTLGQRVAAAAVRCWVPSGG